MKIAIELDGERFDVTFDEDGHAVVDDVKYRIRSHRNGHSTAVTVEDTSFTVAIADARTATINGQRTRFAILDLEGVEGLPDAAAGALGPMRPPMTGRVDAIMVQEGDEVEKGQVLFVLEAMKMQNEIKSPAAARVKAVHAKAGDTVDAQTVILELEAPE